MSKHINYSSAFNTIASSYILNSASNFLRNRSYGSYSVQEPGMASRRFGKRGYGFRFKRRGRTTQRKRKFRGRSARLTRRVRRIARTLHRKGINSVEIKYSQGQFVTPNTAGGVGYIGTLGELVNDNTRTAQVSLSSGIAKGTNRDQRVGNKAFLRHLRFKCLVQASVKTEAVAELYVTILIVRVKDAQGSTASYGTEVPYLTNIYEFIGNTANPPSINGQNGGRGAFINNWHYINSRWKDDFTIIKKKTFPIGKPDGSHPLKRTYKITLPIFKPMYWDDNNFPSDGHLYLYYWCDQVTTDDNVIADGDRPRMWGSWRVSYTDV